MIVTTAIITTLIVSGLIGWAMLMDKGFLANKLMSWFIVVVFFTGLIAGLIVKLGLDAVAAIIGSIVVCYIGSRAFRHLLKPRQEAEEVLPHWKKVFGEPNDPASKRPTRYPDPKSYPCE